MSNKKRKIKEICDHAIKQQNLLNGGMSCFGNGDIYSVECNVGDGYVEDGKLYTLSNMYRITFYNRCNGVTIYKSNSISIHYKCFTCGETIELFGKNFFEKGCRVFEELKLEEILTKLVNRDFLSYKTIAQNEDNYAFLQAMQKRLTRVLIYHKLIYYSEKQRKYVDMIYKKYGM